MNFLNQKNFFSVCFFCLLFSAFCVQANSPGDVVNFYVEKDFDILNRDQIQSTLVKTSNKLNFYIDKSWWDLQSQDKKTKILLYLDDLSVEFEDNIYPKITSLFGYEWNPGIDKNSKINILFQQINNSEGGYFREADEYEKIQVPMSNEREMLYLAVLTLEKQNAKIALAHEFVHLITFNQKNKILNIEEDIWLNEARADYSSTILGYDDDYVGNNLWQRVKDFAENPSDSIIDWNKTKYDYASVSLFTHYLVDHYGISVLKDSLKSKYTGIDSINYALQNNGAKENFSQVFVNWTIALVINDCSTNSKYCYLNPNLKNFKLNPTLNFLPLIGSSSLSVSNDTKTWSGNWLKFIGGSGDLKLSFSGILGVDYFLPYIVEDDAGSRAVNFAQFNKEGKSEIKIDNFGKDYKYLIIMPSIQSKNLILNGLESRYPFKYTVYMVGDEPNTDQDVIQKLLEKIDSLKKQIAEILSKRGETIVIQSCSKIESNLYLGVKNNNQIKCLQEFLKSQGTDIYPEGYITGFFGNLTDAAVKRFQEKYASEILIPIGLNSGTGYVGNLTRQKINSMLNFIN
jgi:peptidoglycan hydrolase-like protein with peptidoglycan-binding domain